MFRSHLLITKLWGLMDSSEIEELSLFSVTVRMSLDVMKSIDSNHLEIKLLEFQVPSQTSLLLALEGILILGDLIGTVDQPVAFSVSTTSFRWVGEVISKFELVSEIIGSVYWDKVIEGLELTDGLEEGVEGESNS